MSSEKQNSNIPVKKFLDVSDFKLPYGEDLIKAILNLKKEKKAFIISKETEIKAEEIFDFVGEKFEQIVAIFNLKSNDVEIMVCEDEVLAKIIKKIQPEKKIIFSETGQLSLEQIYYCLKYELPIVE